METPDGYSHKPSTPPLLNCGLSGQSESENDLGGSFFCFPEYSRSPRPDVNVALKS